MGEVIEFPLYEEAEEPPVDCPNCGGHAVIELREPPLYGPVVAVKPCPACKGTGRG